MFLFPYIDNGYPLIYPFLPRNCDLPPTLYSILDSIVNFGKPENEKIKVPQLSENGRSTIFNFDYPLSNNISKEKFETMILNHFLLRRIGFDTVTSFVVQLNVKLNEIMPMYNKMFDAEISRVDSEKLSQLQDKIVAASTLASSILLFVICLFLPLLIKIEENTRQQLNLMLKEKENENE